MYGVSAANAVFEFPAAFKTIFLDKIKCPNLR